MGWVALLAWAAKVGQPRPKIFYPFRMHVVVGVFACLVRTVKRAGGISEI